VIKGIQARKEESLAKLSELYGSGPPEFDIVLAEHPLATDEMKGQRLLPEFRDKQMWEKAASSPFAWAELLWHLAEIGDLHSGIHTRGAIATNPKTPVTLLEKLADKKEYWWVKKKVANNPSTTAALLEKLASDKNDWVRAIVASNPNTNPATLEMLAGDAEFGIRYRVAENLNTPASALEKLAGDKGVSRFSWKLGIKGIVAQHPNTSASVLRILAGDEDERIRAKVAENPNTPLLVQVKLVEEGVGDMYKIAKCRNTPVAVLEKALVYLSECCDGKIIAAVTPNTPIAILKKLLKDKDVSVRVAAAENPNIPAELLVSLPHAVAKNPDTPPEILKNLAGDHDSEIRRYVANNPNTSAFVLEKLAKDKCEVVRWEAASNSNTTLSTLEILACDAETRVRKTARDTLRRRKSIISAST